MCAGREGVTPPSGDPGPVSLRAGKNRSGEGEKNMSVQAIDRGEEPSEEIIADLTRWQAVLDDMLPVNARDDDETEANNGG